MPKIYRYVCSVCNFVFEVGWGGYVYVIDDKGRRRLCEHPGEVGVIRNVLVPKRSQKCEEKLEDVFEVLEKIVSNELSKDVSTLAKELHLSCEAFMERVGYEYKCICLDCLKMFYLDLGGITNEYFDLPGVLSFLREKAGRDERRCPYCGSKNVEKIEDLSGRICPVCRRGRVLKVWTGSVA